MFLLKIQNWFFVKRKTDFSKVNFPNVFLCLRWLVVWHTRLNNFAKRQRNHSNSKDDNRKRELFRKRNVFFIEIFLWKREFLLVEPWKKLLDWKTHFYLYQSPKKFEIMFNFKKKMFSLKTLKRYVDCSFDNQAGNFSLIAKKTSLKNLKKVN